MSVTAVVTRATDTELVRLRAELKAWERSFAERHGGRKASRDDIKRHADIADKYKIYNRLRAGDEAHHDSPRTLQPPPPPPPASTAAIGVLSTPHGRSLKRKRVVLEHVDANLSNTQDDAVDSTWNHPAVIDPYDSPRHKWNTPTPKRVAVGPTPQRNGYVLGLFDLLSPPTPEQSLGARNSKSSCEAQTPSKSKSMQTASKLKAVLEPEISPAKHLLCAGESLSLPEPDPNIPDKTPSSIKFKRIEMPSASCSNTPIHRRQRTPQSSGRRAFLDLFLKTPSMQRSSKFVSCRNRSNVSPTLEEPEPPELTNEPASPSGEVVNTAESAPISPMTVRLPRKPVGRSLSAMVQSLREMEEERMDDDLALLNEMEADIPTTHLASSRFVGQDTRELTPPETAKVDEIKAPRWKKKGHKRTTRMAKIRPTTAKWKPEPAWMPGINDKDSGANASNADDSSFTDESEHDKGVDQEADTARASQARHKEKKARQPDKHPARKITSLAHTNFRALKIKNKNTRAKGRFGRRR